MFGLAIKTIRESKSQKGKKMVTHAILGNIPGTFITGLKLYTLFILFIIFL